MATTHESADKLPKSKLQSISLELLEVSDEVNCRVHTGQVLYGVTSQVDTYNLKSLMTEIREAGGVRVRLKVHKVGDTYIVLCGNRRTLACKALIKDPNTSQELVKKLDKMECEVFEALTEDQIHSIVNDQDVKRFMKTDFVTLIWRCVQGGWTFRELALKYYAQYAAIFGAQKQLVKVEQAPTDTERQQLIMTWLRGGLDQTIIRAFGMGDRVRKAYLLTVMKEDLLLETGMEQPEFYVNHKRLTELSKIKTEDESWNVTTGSTQFNECIERFIKEDKTGKVETNPRPTVTDLKARAMNSGSKVGQAAFKIAAGDKVLEFSDWDAEAKRMEDVIKVIASRIDSIKDAKVATVLAMVLKSVNTLEMDRILEQYC